MSLTATDRSTAAQIAAHTRWAKEPDRAAATRAARDGRWQRYLDKARELAPTGSSEEEIVRRAESLRKADMRRMSLAAARAKRSKAKGAA